MAVVLSARGVAPVLSARGVALVLLGVASTQP
jgi:hypothetical protein